MTSQRACIVGPGAPERLPQSFLKDRGMPGPDFLKRSVELQKTLAKFIESWLSPS